MAKSKPARQRRNKDKEIANLEAELKFLKKTEFKNSVTYIIGQTIRCGGICILGFFAYGSISELAGKKTDAKIEVGASVESESLKGLGETLIQSATYIVLFAIIISLAIAWRIQKAIAKNNREKFTARIAALETALDGRRTSSKLESDGSTNRKEKP